VVIASVPAGRLGVPAIGNWAHPVPLIWRPESPLAVAGEQATIAINNARMIKALEGEKNA